MTDPETTMSEYIKGFDAGYDYTLREIERWIKQHNYEPRVTGSVEKLLAHLKMEGREIT